jgi:hypothetical protein
MVRDDLALWKPFFIDDKFVICNESFANVGYNTGPISTNESNPNPPIHLGVCSSTRPGLGSRQSKPDFRTLKIAYPSYQKDRICTRRFNQPH